MVEKFEKKFLGTWWVKQKRLTNGACTRNKRNQHFAKCLAMSLIFKNESSKCFSIYFCPKKTKNIDVNPFLILNLKNSCCSKHCQVEKVFSQEFFYDLQ